MFNQAIYWIVLLESVLVAYATVNLQTILRDVPLMFSRSVRARASQALNTEIINHDHIRLSTRGTEQRSRSPPTS